MKVIRNIPALSKLAFSLTKLGKLKKQIDSCRVAGDLEGERQGIKDVTALWSGYLMKKFNITVRVEGKENLPTEGPVVFMSNHQGFADIPILFHAIDTLPYGYVARDNLGKIPVYGEWMTRIRGVMIKRDDPRESLKAINEGVDLIKQGFSLCIFPEGTRSQGGPMIPFKPGALKLATKPKVPIVPISIEGSYNCYETTGVFRGKCPVDIIIHPAVVTEGLSRQEEKQLSDKVYKTIYDGVEELKEKRATSSEK